MSNESHETAAKRKRGESPSAGGADPHSHVFEVEQDPEERAGKLVDIAEELIGDSEGRLGKGADGSRAVALHGIGYALCSIACSLELVADAAVADVGRPERVEDAMRELLQARDCFGDQVVPFAKVEPLRRHLKIAICTLSGCTPEEIDALREAPDHTAEDIARAFSGPVCGDGSCASARLDGCYYCADHMPAGTVEVEIKVAVVCIDCQAAQDHGAGYCGGEGCLVCGGGGDDTVDSPLCRGCGGELVLEERAVQSNWLRCGCAVGYHEDRYVARHEVEGHNRCSLGWPRAPQPDKPASSTCEDSSNWCSRHCPLDAAPAPPEPGQACGGQLPRCLEHCT